MADTETATKPQRAPEHRRERPQPPPVPESTETLLRAEDFAVDFVTIVEGGTTLEDRAAFYESDPRPALIARALRAAGVELVSMLGSGSFGVAAMDQNGDIVKLTTDETEVAAGTVLKGQRLTNVVRIDGAWIVRDVLLTRWQDLAVIRVGLLKMERVEPWYLRLHHEGRTKEGTALRDVWSRVRDEYDAEPSKIAAMPPEQARKTLYEASIELEQELRKLSGVTKGYEVARVATDVADALGQLRGVGVYAIDVHTGNIGYSRDDGVFKVYDIGSSSSPAGTTPQQLPHAGEAGGTRYGGVVDEAVTIEEIGGDASASEVAESDRAELLLTPYLIAKMTGMGAVGFIRMSPADFLSLTTYKDPRDAPHFPRFGVNSPEGIKRDAAPLEAYNDAIRADRIDHSPWLEVGSDGTVNGEEGRHRAAAVEKAGGDSLMVAIIMVTDRGGRLPPLPRRLSDMPRTLKGFMPKYSRRARVRVSLDGAIDLYAKSPHASEEARSAHDTRVDDMVTKYMALLGVTQRPRIVIHDNVGSPWLGRDIWTTRDPSTSTIELQKSILGDDRTLERIIAHEMVHHRDMMNLTPHQISMLHFGIKPDGHGESFRHGAALINEAMGADFVTKTSDQNFVQAPGRPFYVLIGRQADAFGFRGIPADKYGYKWAVRLSDQAKLIVEQETSLGARLVVTNNERWTHGKARIKPYAGWNIPSKPEDQAELKALYDGAQS